MSLHRRLAEIAEWAWAGVIPGTGHGGVRTTFVEPFALISGCAGERTETLSHRRSERGISRLSIVVQHQPGVIVSGVVPTGMSSQLNAQVVRDHRSLSSSYRVAVRELWRTCGGRGPSAETVLRHEQLLLRRDVPRDHVAKLLDVSGTTLCGPYHSMVA